MRKFFKYSLIHAFHSEVLYAVYIVILSIMVSEKMGLPFYRRRGRRRRGRRPVHSTNFLEKWLFSIIYFEKTIQSIFMKFSGFVYHVKDYSYLTKHFFPRVSSFTIPRVS